LDWSRLGWVQLTEGAAIRAANCSCMDGNGMAILRDEPHHRAIERQE
jgi:hypothetical protein